MTTIALVEDDNDIAFTVKLNLERDGFNVSTFDRGQNALAAVQRGGFDFVILDLNLPDLDGLTICRELRRAPETRSIPIIMLTARGSERDRVTGLEFGADDYVTKPFSVRELVARVGGICRRMHGTEDALIFEDAEIRIEQKAYRVFRRGTEIKLARKEFELLWLLVQQKSHVLSRERLLSQVWQMSEDVETRTVDVHIRNLRRKIGADRIATVVGFGYRYDPARD